MRRSQLRFLLVAAIPFLVVALLAGCSHRVKLKEVPADLIPETYKESLREDEWDTLIEDSVVWRVYEDFGDYVLVACTYRVDFRGERSSGLRMWASSSSGEWKTGSGGGGFNESDLGPFGAWLSAERSKPSVVSRLDAGGIAWDTRIAEIKVVMTDGTVVKTEPIDGFWVIPFGIEVKDDKFHEILALDGKGQVLYSQKGKESHFWGP
jgi:hypothetical protein